MGEAVLILALAVWVPASLAGALMLARIIRRRERKRR